MRIPALFGKTFVFGETDKNGKHVIVALINSITGKGGAIWLEDVSQDVVFERCDIHSPSYGYVKSGFVEQSQEKSE